MKNLRVKKHLQGVIVTKNIFHLGNVTFDPYKVVPDYYKNYKDLGFDLFDEVEEKQEKKAAKK